MKKIIAIFLILMVALTSCLELEDSAENDQAKKTKDILNEINKSVGMPAIKNFQEKKLAKMIFELRDREDLITYAYLVSMNGNLIFLGECIGFGLPYSVQYTNPQRIVDADKEVEGSFSRGNDAFVLPQADPNGLYMPEGLSATWLMMLDKETGDVRPVYVEPEIVVSPFKLH